MKFVKKWLINLILIMIFSYLNVFVYLEHIESIVILSLVVTLIQLVVKLLVFILVSMGLFTIGLSLIPAFILNVLSLPLAFYIAQDYVAGFYVQSFGASIIFSICVTIAQNVLDAKKE